MSRAFFLESVGWVGSESRNPVKLVGKERQK